MCDSHFAVSRFRDFATSWTIGADQGYAPIPCEPRSTEILVLNVSCARFLKTSVARPRRGRLLVFANFLKPAGVRWLQPASENQNAGVQHAHRKYESTGKYRLKKQRSMHINFRTGGSLHKLAPVLPNCGCNGGGLATKQ